MSNEKITAAERKQQAKDFINQVDTIRKTEGVTLEVAAKKAGKTSAAYYYYKQASGQKKNKAITAKATRKRRTTSNLPVTTGFTEIPATLRTANTGNGKMLLAVAVGDGNEIARALETTLNRFFT